MGSFDTLPEGSWRKLGREPLRPYAKHGDFARSIVHTYVTRTSQPDRPAVIGADRLASGKNQLELRKITKEINHLKKLLNELEMRKAEIEGQMKQSTEDALAAKGRGRKRAV